MRWITRMRKRVARKRCGTTGRGIGPAYEDKVAHRAVCVLATFSTKKPSLKN
ncbi:adenylosuccinate synthetase [Escherichia coli]